MTLSKLSLLSFGELKQIARKMSIAPSYEIDRNSLLKIIFEAVEDERLERWSSTNLAVRVEATKFFVGNDEEVYTSSSEDTVLPSRYNESRVVIMLRDLSWLYCYWDIEDSKLEEIYQKPGFSNLFLRVNRLQYRSWARNGFQECFETSIDFDDLDRYIELPSRAGYYGVELGAKLDSTCMVIVRSNILDTMHSRLKLSGAENSFPDKSQESQKDMVFSTGSINNNSLTSRIAMQNKHRKERNSLYGK